jgi:CRP-like cAMP-binding protein
MSTNPAVTPSDPVNTPRNLKIFEPGSIIFKEGDTTTEMYLILSGTVQILKQEGENSFELAQLGKGSVLGELSLLDHQPRSATARVLEKSSATIIDETLFKRTLAELPSWLTNIIKVVVSRLRETIKKTGELIVRQNLPGVIRVLTLLYDKEGFTKNGASALSLQTARDTIAKIIGLSSLDIDNILRLLVRKNFLTILKNDKEPGAIIFKNLGALRLYMDYLRAKQRGSALPGEALSERARELIGIFLVFRQKKEGDPEYPYFTINDSNIVVDVQKAGSGILAELDIFQELTEAKVLSRRVDNAHNRLFFDYEPEVLQRIHLLGQWLPVFNEE